MNKIDRRIALIMALLVLLPLLLWSYGISPAQDAGSSKVVFSVQ